MANIQTRVQALLDRLVGRDVERGLQVAAYFDGELVVDAWAGIADAATGRLVDGETLFTMWSAGKGVAATVMHLLADRDRLAYHAPTATAWPTMRRSPPTGPRSGRMASRRSPWHMCSPTHRAFRRSRLGWDRSSCSTGKRCAG